MHKFLKEEMKLDFQGNHLKRDGFSVKETENAWILENAVNFGGKLKMHRVTKKKVEKNAKI